MSDRTSEARIHLPNNNQISKRSLCGSGDGKTSSRQRGRFLSVHRGARLHFSITVYYFGLDLPSSDTVSMVQDLSGGTAQSAAIVVVGGSRSCNSDQLALH